MTRPQIPTDGMPPVGRPILDLANALYLRSGMMPARGAGCRAAIARGSSDRGSVGAEDSVGRDYFRFAGLRFAAVFFTVFLAADLVFDFTAFFAMLPS
jgi:hypothetical protein